MKPIIICGFVALMAAWPVGASAKPAAAGTTRDRAWTGTVACDGVNDVKPLGKRSVGVSLGRIALYEKSRSREYHHRETLL